MPTTFANTIDGNDIYAKRAECDAAGNTLSTTYATKSELPTIVGLTAGSNITITEGQDSITISATDTTYSAGTGLSLSGTTFSNSDPLPAHTSTESGKVLGVDSNGDLGWVNQSGGGGSYSAGTGIDITNDVISVDTSVVATQTDLAGKEDAFDVGTGLEMDTSGVTPTLQVEAPVDIVAGPGIVIDNPDGNTLRVSTNANYETVLYEDTSYTLGRTSVTLSESYKNFEIIKVFTNKGDVVFLKTDNPQSVNTCTLTHFSGANIWSIPWTFTDNTTFTGAPGVMLYSDSGTIKSVTVGSDAPYGRWEQPVKIVGIHRIASN